jgi:hypothetical protein
MKLLSIDTETGGLNEKCDLLTISFAVIDDNFEIDDFLDLKVKPDPDKNNRTLFTVESEALTVNNIDLIQHDAKAMTYKKSKPIIYNWLKLKSEKYGCKLTPFGNGIKFDIEKIALHTISMDSFQEFIERNPIELTSIGKTLKLLGKIPDNQSLALSNIAKYFDIEVDENLCHSSKYDVWLGAQVYKNYLKLISPEK